MATTKLSTTIAGIVAGATGATGPTGPTGATGASGATTTISNGTSNLNIASSGGAITANTSGNTALTIDTSGNIGIGTPSPTTYSGKVSIVKTSAAGETVPLSIINSDATINTAVSLGFAPNVNIDLARITALRTDANGATDLQIKTYTGSSLTEKARITSDGQIYHNISYLLGSSYNCYYGKSVSGGNTIVNSGFTNTGLSVANVYIPTNVRKVLMWFHVTLRANGLGNINHTGFRIKMVRNSDSSTSYIGNSSWGIGIAQPLNTTQSQNWATVSQFVNLYDYDNDGNGAGITAGQTYTFYLMANDAYASGSQLRIGSEADGSHQTYTPQHAVIWVL